MLKIAWRNILRNKRRTLLSLLLIIISISVLFLALGYTKDVYKGLKMGEIHQHGHLQIAKQGHWNLNNTKRKLLTKAEINKIKTILNKNKAVIDYSATLKVSGILGTEKNSTVISGTGINPNSSQSVMIKSGTKLFPGDKNRILIGQGIKEKLNLETGDWVSIMATTPGGAYNAQSLKVSGSFTTRSDEADKRYVLIPLSFAQTLLDTEGVDKFKVTLSQNKLTKPTINQLQQQFNNHNLNVELKSWKQLTNYYYQVKNLYDATFIFLAVIIFILVFFSILEIMSMAFFERMEEIGTARAIGTTKGQIFTQLIQEALILGLVGGIIGVICGWGLGNLINNLQITYTPPNSTEPVPLSINLALTNGLVPFIIVMVSTLLSAIYPAVKAARLNVVDMLRHV